MTAISVTQTGSEMEEHHILGAALKALLRHRVLPAAVLQGSLVGMTPPVRALTIRQNESPLRIDLWDALKGKPRASLHYTLTVAVDVGEPEDMAKPVVQLDVGGP